VSSASATPKPSGIIGEYGGKEGIPGQNQIVAENLLRLSWESRIMFPSWHMRVKESLLLQKLTTSCGNEGLPHALSILQRTLPGNVQYPIRKVRERASQEREEDIQYSSHEDTVNLDLLPHNERAACSRSATEEEKDDGYTYPCKMAATL